jgi:hypothetical protein
VSFRCGVEFYRAIDSLGSEVGGAAVAFLNGTKNVTTTATFDCNASDLLRIKPDGTLAYRDSATVIQCTPSLSSPVANDKNVHLDRG